MQNENSPIGLQELILKVKQELLSNIDNTQPLFFIKELELEISFTVDRTINGGIDLQIVQSGVEKNWGQVQKVKLTLDPILERSGIIPDLSLGEKEMAKKALQRNGQEIE